MKKILLIVLVITMAALFSPRQPAAQTTVEALPRTGAPIPQIGAPNPNMPLGGESQGVRDQTVTVPDSEMEESEPDAPEPAEGAQDQPYQDDSGPVEDQPAPPAP